MRQLVVSACAGALLFFPARARAGEREARDPAPAIDVAPRGPVVQLRIALDAPVGGAVPLPLGRLDRLVHAELVPLRLDLGYRFPHVYIGVFGQKSHGTFEATRLVPAETTPSSGDVSSFELGATAEYHFTPRELLDPWLGIYGARRSMWFTNEGATGVRFRGPEAGLTAGVDAHVLSPITIGVFVAAGYSILGVAFDDDTHPIDSHAKATWLGAGLRISAFL